MSGGPTEAELREYCDLLKRRRELEREARGLGSRIETIAEKCRGWLESKGVDSCRRHGYGLALVDGRRVVPWKDAFVAEVGPDRANEFAEKVPIPKRLEVVAP